MNRRDEKKGTFEAMLDELDSASDSDDSSADTEDELPQRNKTIGVSRVAEAKPVPVVSSAYSSSDSYAATGGGSKMSQVDKEIAKFGSAPKSRHQVDTTAQSKGESTDQNETIAELKNWLMRPCRADDPSILCYVERERNALGQTKNIYRCYLEGSKAVEKLRGHIEGEVFRFREAKFLMSAKKRSHNKTSNYLISTEKDPSEDRGSFSVLGKLRGDTFGSRYTILDAGIAPEKAITPSTLRKELGVVQFQFDSGGPSEISAWIPSVTYSGVAQTWYPANTIIQSETTDMVKAIESDEWRGRLLQLVNVKPKWDDVHGGHVLNFQGRVTESSVKNFQLCCPELPTPPQSATEYNTNADVILQFGKAGRDKFSMDVRYPLSIYSAFAICVACLDGKLADRKGFEFFRGLSMNSAKNPSTASRKDEMVHVEGSMQGEDTLGTGTSSVTYLKDKLSRAFK